MPQATLRPVLDLNNPEAIARWLVSNQARFDYRSEVFV
jgi:molybdopterin-guanine dinucleotide biosynthesis protein B